MAHKQESVSHEKHNLPMTRRCFELVLDTLFCFGFWPDGDDIKGGLFYYWRYYFPRVCLFRLFYSIIFQLINIALFWGNLSQMIEFFTMLLVYNMSFIKGSTLFYKHDQLRQIVANIKALNADRIMIDEYMRASRNKTTNFAHKFTLFFLAVMIPIFIAVGVVLILQGFYSGSIPFRYWLPYNYDNSPLYEITLITTMTALTFDLIIILLCDLLFISMIIHLNGQFKLLNHKFTDIKVAVNKTRRRQKKEIACFPGPTSHKVASSSSHALVLVAHRKDEAYKRNPPQHLPEQRISERNKIGMKSQVRSPVTSVIKDPATTRSEMNKEMKLYLRTCAKHHQMLLSLTEMLGQAYKPTLMLQILCNLACGVVALYITTVAKKTDFKVSVSAFLVFGCYLETLLYCWFANQVTEESHNVRHSVYGCDWFSESTAFKSSIRIILARCNRPLIIRAAGLPLSMRTFRTIYKTAYYIHMVGTRIFHGVKIARNS